MERESEGTGTVSTAAPSAAVRCTVTRAALASAPLTPPLRRAVRKLTAAGGASHLAAPVLVACASEILLRPKADWSPASPATRYLVILDVPDPAVPRIAAALQIRRPEHRLHVTRDPGVLRRLAVAGLRGEPFLGIVDAYVLGDALHVVTGDLEFRSFPLARLPSVSALPRGEWSGFEIDPDGSYLHWPARDIHLGTSQILQALDPMYLADVEIERHSRDGTGAALRSLREEVGLRQTDIAGLGERQVRRIEDGISRLRLAAAEKLAAAFGLPLGAMLDEIAKRAGKMAR